MKSYPTILHSLAPGQLFLMPCPLPPASTSFFLSLSWLPLGLLHLQWLQNSLSTGQPCPFLPRMYTSPCTPFSLLSHQFLPLTCTRWPFSNQRGESASLAVRTRGYREMLLKKAAESTMEPTCCLPLPRSLLQSYLLTCWPNLLVATLPWRPAGESLFLLWACFYFAYFYFLWLLP